MAIIHDWEFHTVDVNSTFLNSELLHNQPAVYMKQPKGFVIEGQENKVWELLKALYGLKQAACLWYDKLKKIMIKLGFKICICDPCVFICVWSRQLSIVFVSPVMSMISVSSAIL